MHQVKTNAFLRADVRMGFFWLESGLNFRRGNRPGQQRLIADLVGSGHGAVVNFFIGSAHVDRQQGPVE